MKNVSIVHCLASLPGSCVALVFSCIAAVLGLIAITIYGLSDINNIEERVARDLDVDIVPEDDAIEGSSSEIVKLQSDYPKAGFPALNSNP